MRPLLSLSKHPLLVKVRKQVVETKCSVAFNLLERWCRERACVRALVPQGVSPESDQEGSTRPSRRTLRFDGGEPRPRSLRRWGEAPCTWRGTAQQSQGGEVCKFLKVINQQVRTFKNLMDNANSCKGVLSISGVMYSSRASYLIISMLILFKSLGVFPSNHLFKT